MWWVWSAPDGEGCKIQVVEVLNSAPFWCAGGWGVFLPVVRVPMLAMHHVWGVEFRGWMSHDCHVITLHLYIGLVVLWIRHFHVLGISVRVVYQAIKVKILHAFLLISISYFQCSSGYVQLSKTLQTFSGYMIFLTIFLTSVLAIG